MLKTSSSEMQDAQLPGPPRRNRAVLQTGIQLSTGWLRIRCRMITLISEVFGST